MEATMLLQVEEVSQTSERLPEATFYQGTI